MSGRTAWTVQYMVRLRHDTIVDAEHGDERQEVHDVVTVPDEVQRLCYPVLFDS